MDEGTDTTSAEMWGATLLRGPEPVRFSKCRDVGNRLQFKCRDRPHNFICTSLPNCSRASKRPSFCVRLKRALSDGRGSGWSLVIVNRPKKPINLGAFRFQSTADDESRVSVGRQLASGSDGDVGLPVSEKLARDTGLAGKQCLGGQQGFVDVKIDKTGNNSRKIGAKIFIEGPLEDVWAVLTDYEHLADFFPGLAVSKLMEKRGNRVRLYQVGQQNLAFGLKFKAIAILDCEEKPAEVHQNVTRRDIDFEMVEGDFQVFRGTWRMEEQTGTSSTFEDAATRRGRKVITALSYILSVQPKLWLPVGLVEGILTNEIITNLTCIRDRSLQPPL